ncbi:hypothetical protein GOA99_18790 [Sinorhizobium meliloti]|nr:hypothetical protein [Sinorhizobium meliloti]
MQFDQVCHSAELSALEGMLALHFSQRDMMPVVNGTRIDREWYLSAVGTPLCPHAAETFDRFDQLAQEAMRIDEPFLALLDDHVSTAIAQRALAIKNGVLIRQRIAEWFGWPRWVRKIPMVASRLDFWDEELVRCRYVPDWKAISQERKRWASSPPLKWSVFRTRVSSRYVAAETSIDRLKAVLEKHFQAGSFLRDRQGRLSASGYAELAGIPSVTPAHKKVLRDYQRRSGPVLSLIEQKIPKIREWFETCVSNRTLPVRGSKIEVTALRSKFSITMGWLKSSEDLQNLIADFNKELIRVGYRGADDFELERKLLRALRNAKLQTNGLAIDTTALGRRLKCPNRVLQRSPFKEHIAKANDAHIATIAADPAWAYFPEHRAVDFRPLIKAGWSSTIIHITCKALRENLSGYTRGRRNQFIHMVVQLLTKLATSKVKCVRLAFAAINQRGRLTDHDWKSAIDELGRDLSRNSVVCLNNIIALLGREEVFPVSKHRLPVPSRVKGGGNRTVAEVGPNLSKGAVTTIGTETMPVARLYVSFANWVLLQKSSWNEGTTEFRGDSFLAVLQAEIENWRGDLPKDPVQAISQIISRRLNFIRDAAERDFAFWRGHYLEGQQLRSEGVDPGVYGDILFGSDLDSNQYRQTLSQYLPAEPEKRRQGLANLVRLVHDRFGGMVPRDREIEGRFFIHRCKQFGIPVDNLQGYLTPHREAHAAAMTMYLVESGCNVAVARTLFHDCIEDTDMHGFRKITGYKARAKGKPIVVNLPEDSKALDALCWLRDTSEIAREAAPQAIRELLFIAVVRHEVVEISPDWFLAAFKRIVGKVPELSALGITPVMLRPSVLLRHALDNDGDLRVGLAYGQHDPSQTGVYQVRLPTKFIYDQLYSQFQKRFQKIILGMAAQLRADETLNLGPEAKPIGIGGVCAAGGCSELTCWKNCSNLVVIPEINALADWQIWNTSLREVRSDWERDRLERWEAMWLPFLCFTDVLAEKMQQGSDALSRLWDAATQRAKDLMSTEGFVMPRPF